MIENHSNGCRSPNKFLIGFCVLFVFWYLLLYGLDWSSLPGISPLPRDSINLASDHESCTTVDHKSKNNNSDSCWGRYIYVHDIPSRFNVDYIKQCKLLNKWQDMCQYLMNEGLGQGLRDGWFATHQFSLEVIFHNRMKQYRCLTNDSSKASAIYVPYYPGLDVARFLWDDRNASRKDIDALALFDLLRAHPQWKLMGGKDHFMVCGRITWDFRRIGPNVSVWGSTVMVLPETQNMTMLTIESSPWDKNDFAIPYPTYFHPSTDAQVYGWQTRMRKQRRRSLFCFAGAPRPNMEKSIRDQIMAQCASAKNKCRLMECRNDDKHNCLKPTNVMKMFQNSVFCLQPPGDSFTRRSTFDSILAGCIPVFFTPASAYVQYLWHLPKDFASYSVLIPEDDVKLGKVSIDSVLSEIPKSRVLEMRENVIKLIPNVIYADPKSRLEKLDDAFEVTVKGVIERVESLRKQRNDESAEFGSEFSWKYYTFGSTKPHQWDHYFRRQ
ncbi:Exostosin family protein [Perilla frutescens var. frutescens]|nr:Exostosin family protein [Perilla frutescens var. frutescens]